MAYKNKTYICFDGDSDMNHYRMMTAWSANERFAFSFHNAHDINTARDSSQEESIKRQLRERFANSKQLVVLIGERTKLLTKFVKWEMEVALRLGLPIIGVNLNGSRQSDRQCPLAIQGELAVFVPFGAKIIEYAMTNWPADHARYRSESKAEHFHYMDHVYKNLGL